MDMDTVPFHLMLFALDIAIVMGLFFWIRSRRNVRSVYASVYHFEKSLYIPTAIRRPSLVWDIAGVLLFGAIWLACFVVSCLFIFTNFAQEHIYHFNVGQCIVEGIAIHGTLFLIVAAALLFWNRRRTLAILSGCCALFLAAFSFNVLYWEPYHLQVEYYEVRTTKLTKPLRIVFVADIQTDRIGFHEINTVKKIQEQNADLIILGGDYIQTFAGTQDKHLPEHFRQLFLDYPLEASLGVYAIPGNVTGHAGVSDAALFRDTSVEYIRNTRNPKIIANLGADKGWEPPIDLVLLSLGHSIGGLGERGLTDSGNFIVMAGHYPTYAINGYTPETGEPRSGYRNAERAPDLMLAGHTHGGQIVIPFYGPIPKNYDRLLLQVPRTMWSGFFAYPNGGHLLITRGSGLERGWAPRIRLFCPAEISVIDIIPESR